jgi:hypothetical protein
LVKKFEAAPGRDQSVHTRHTTGGGIAKVVQHPQKILKTGQAELRRIFIVQLSEICQESCSAIRAKTVAQAANASRNGSGQWVGQVTD